MDADLTEMDERIVPLIQQLEPPVPFTLDGFRACLERRCRRTIRMISITMPPGAPSGAWLQFDSADFLFYEEHTSVFHQAHIVASLAARMLLAGTAGAAVSHQLVPNVDVQPQRLLSGARVGDAVSDSEAEAFAFEVLQRSCVFPDDLRAELLLRRLQPLRSAVHSAGLTAAHAAHPGSPAGVTARLYFAVIEIRDAALALRRNEAMALTAAFAPQGAAEETCVQVEGQTCVQALKAATNVASTIRKLDTDMAPGRQDRSTDASSLIASPIDLCREVSRLAGIM